LNTTGDERRTATGASFSAECTKGPERGKEGRPAVEHAKPPNTRKQRRRKAKPKSIR